MTNQRDIEVNLQPSLRFTRYNICNLSFSVDEKHWKDETVSKEVDLKMGFATNLTELDSTSKDGELKLVFNVDVFKEDKSFNLSFQAVAYFNTQGIDESTEIGAALVSQSAPAIIFPYVRATISTVTQQLGFSPVILPVFNFTKPINKEES